jgi:hypothetical protein
MAMSHMSHHDPTKVLILASRIEQSLNDDRGRLIDRYSIHRSQNVGLGLNDTIMYEVAKRGGYTGRCHGQLALEQLLGVPTTDPSCQDAQGVPGGYGMNVALDECQ